MTHSMDVTFARTELPNRQKNHPNATFGIRSNTAPNTVVLVIHVAYKIKNLFLSQWFI